MNSIIKVFVNAQNRSLMDRLESLSQVVRLV